MNAVQQIIRILVIILICDHTRCQNGFSDREVLRYQQMAPNDGQIEAITTYNNNIIQRDPNSQSVSSVNVQYRMTDDSNNDDYHRADRTRTRKVYRIKNPFQNQEDRQNEENLDLQDSGAAASNQYASMQYSLPPDDFLQQMRENQYFQQQHQPQTTPAPSLGYTATPQPQYQYSTIISSNTDHNQQSNQIPQLETKSHTQYLTNNAYQFSPQNTFPFDNVQSTPSPVGSYVSTALPGNQYVDTPNNYVSSSAPLYFSSQPNLQYVSSPLTSIQTGTPDYSGNRVTSTIGSNSLSIDNNDQNKKMQIDHYDNSANGIRYPLNIQQQYQNEYESSTPSSTPSSYSDSRDTWQQNINGASVNALSKSLQELSLMQYQNFPQDARFDSTVDTNSDTHRIGNIPSANNMYLNFAPSDYTGYNNIKGRTRDTEQETRQPEYYSNGEYGWKLSGRKPQFPSSNEVYSQGNSGQYQRYQQAGLQSNNGAAVSQMNFHIDTSRPAYNYEQVSKSAADNIEAQDFAKAAAKAHEFMKQQQSYYGNNYGNNNNNNPTSLNTNQYYNQDNQKYKYNEASTLAPYMYGSQPDVITVSPYFNGKENNVDYKSKQPFDHAKALKNIVPIDVSNVISNSESSLKSFGGVENNKYAQNYGKDQINQAQQQYRPLTDSYYKDKNAIYGFNIKTKSDEYTPDNYKQYDTNVPYYAKLQQSQDTIYTQGAYATGPQRISYIPQPNYSDNLQPSAANIQQQGIQRPQIQVASDINNILKLNDVPYQLTQNISPETFRFNNNDFDRGALPTSLPVRINQDVASHQLDVSSNILQKLLLNKQVGYNTNGPELETQSNTGLSMINGFKVANPFNVDLKLVAEMLKGKSVDNTNLMSFRDQFNKPAPPLKLDLTQLQHLLKNDNFGGLSLFNNGLGAYSSPFLDIYNTGRYPYQGVKYSRSQEEEEETIVPIADGSSNHPIGAVSEQDDPTHEHEGSTGSDTTAQDDEISINYEDDRPKKSFIQGHRMSGDRHRHPNSLITGKHSYQRKYPKSVVDEPYPLLKPPPPHSSRGRSSHLKSDKHRRRRVNKPRIFRLMKSEPLFESETEGENVENSVPTLLRPPPPVVEKKSDSGDEIELSS